MALYRYIKAPPQKPKTYKIKRITSTFFMFMGTFLLVWVGYPIVSFELTSRVKFAEIVSPVPYQENSISFAEKQNNKAFKKDESALQSFSNLAKSVSDLIPQKDKESTVKGVSDSNDNIIQQDYTKASNWFPSKPQGYSNSAGRIYFLSIPKLRIKDAVVKIAGEDLNQTLIHYGGTGLPGDYGTAVIFGHSILPQFYDPKNYKTIFSLLPKLEKGDEIFIKYDGVSYRYVVTRMRVTGPDDISVLEQRYDSSYIRLITCVPPGTYWKRLAVTARIKPL